MERYIDQVDDLADAVLARVHATEDLLEEVRVSAPVGIELEAFARALEARLSRAGVDFVEVSAIEQSGPPALLACRFGPGWAP